MNSEPVDSSFITSQLNAYLQSHNISNGISGVISGPVITTYMFEPINGVRMQDIEDSLPNIKTLLQNPDINIHHKNGTTFVGLDIPNIDRKMIFVGDLVDNVDNTACTLPIVLGCTQDGEPLVYDLLRSPHIHVIGDKGSGKSTFLSSLIYSLYMKANKKICQISIIDIENDALSAWKQKINIVNEITAVPEYLDGLVNELYTRQRIGLTEETPYLIVVIDDLDKIIQSAKEYAKDIRQNIENLIKYGHRSQIHLIVATKTDSNYCGYIPTRLVFHSDTELTYMGTITPKTLLLYGHALFSDGGRMPIAIHTPYVDIETIGVIE